MKFKSMLLIFLLAFGLIGKSAQAYDYPYHRNKTTNGLYIAGYSLLLGGLGYTIKHKYDKTKKDNTDKVIMAVSIGATALVSYALVQELRMRAGMIVFKWLDIEWTE